MFGDVTGTAPFQRIIVNATTVDIEREESVAVAVGPVVPEINHRSAMGVAPARCVVLGMLRAFCLPEAARPMDVVGAACNEAKRVRVHVLAVHAFVARTGNDVEEVFDDAVRDEHLAVIVEGDAPGIRGAMGDNLKRVSRRMKPPDAAVQPDPVAVRRAGPADPRIGKNAVATVEPAVRSPGETVDDVVFRLETPAVEQDFGRAVRNVVVIAVGNENQLRRGAEPDAAETERDAGKIAALIEEDVPGVEATVAIAVFENDHAVVAGKAVGLPIRVRQTLDHPKAPAIVGGHRDRLNHVRFAGEECYLEAVRDGHAPCRIVEGKRIPDVFWFRALATDDRTEGDDEGADRAERKGRHRRLL